LKDQKVDVVLSDWLDQLVNVDFSHFDHCSLVKIDVHSFEMVDLADWH
jgi:hypothetical protein